MRLTVLGSGTLLPDDRHRSPAHWVEVSESRLLLDCGSGALHAMGRERLWWKGISHIALTHFHTDHTGDLAAVLFALDKGIRPPRSEKLTLIGPSGLHERLEGLARAHGRFVLEPSFPLDVVELDPAGAYRASDFTLRAHGALHSEGALCYRVDAADGAIGYTGDTGPTGTLGAFFEGVDVLVSECSQPDPPTHATHLSPVSVAALAASARPSLLLLTHLFPQLRPHTLPDRVREAGWEGKAIVARDGTTVEVGKGSVLLVEG